ncbi:MAG: UDP-3-O-acyl-N-acetylglucosamine deacetylase [Epsilonproteobacteria bacterium]|nr:UDP-3-O-acyl-N-acetylglucosamine deacetylase [Campylobacterota bacterium]
MKQRTIQKSVEVVGIGLHKGVPVRLKLEPLAEDSGIVFYRADKGVSIELNPSNVVDTKMATVIGKDGVVVSTIEHLMSAVSAFGIDNLRVVVDNDEVPIMDGSSISFVMLLKEAGIKELNAPKKFYKITKPVRVELDNKFVEIKPGSKIVYDFEIDFNHPIIGNQKYRFEFSTKKYIEEIARARTFGFLKEVQYLRSIGLALGGSLENAIVLDEKGILNENLRFPDEFVRHKILDAMGDMSLFGAFIGEYRAFAGGHHLNHLLTKEIIRQNAYEVLTFKEEAKEVAKAFC